MQAIATDTHPLMTQNQAKHLNTVPIKYRGIVARAYSGKSKAAALKAKCLECVGFQRNEITACTAFACPLHPYRPYKDNLPENEGLAPEGVSEAVPESILR